VKAHSGGQGRGPGLLNRDAERGALDRFVAGVRAGQGQSLAGVQSEMELAYAGLHQLCAPLLDHAGDLPGPQQQALKPCSG
jgi:hypothetical protein